MPAIKAQLAIQSAEDDKRINAMWPDFEAALKDNNKSYDHFLYEGTRHGFHNNSTPRFNESAADLAWQRTLDLFKSTLV